jgi:hypothetical protein
MTGTFTNRQGLTLVPHSDPEAPLDAIAAQQAAGFRPMPLDQLDQARPADIAERFGRILDTAPAERR